jgi:succinoglycan biosynthesis transport protein ExoP
MFPGDIHSESTLRDYLRVVRRRSWIIFLTAAVVTVAAVAFSLRQEKLFRASAEVLLSRQNLAAALTGTPDTSGASDPARTAQTQAELARVPEVARRALRAAGVHASPLDFLGRSSVSANPNADLLDFTVDDHDPSLAKRLASSYAKEFVAYRQTLDTASLLKARRDVHSRIAELARTGDTHSALYSNLVETDQRLATMEALETSNASVVRTADQASQLQPRPTRNGILALALGVVLGIGLAFLWEALDTRVRSAEQIGERLGLPLLARLPMPPRPLRRNDRLVMLTDPRSQQAEAFRMLRTNLEFVRLGRDVRTIMVTSCVEQEGKSTTAANLAVALARAGQRVALIDLDLHHPFLDHFFDGVNRPGLTQVAIDQASLDEALIPVSIDDEGEGRRRGRRSRNGYVVVTGKESTALSPGGLRVVVSGPVPPNAGDFVGSEVLGRILGELRDRFDTVLIDAPPMLQLGDAMALSGNVDALMIVARMNVVRRPMLNELHRLLETVPAVKLGFILSGAEREEGHAAAAYRYGYYPPRQRKKAPAA